MLSVRLARPGEVPAAIQLDLLAAVFATLVPALIMSLLFAGVGAAIVAQVRTGELELLFALGLGGTLLRFWLMRRDARHFAGDRLPDAAIVPAVRRRFVASYLLFALLLGLFAGEAIRLGPANVAGLAAVLVTGYAAGVATGVASLPRVAVAAMLLAVVPAIIATAAAGRWTDATMAGMLAAFLAGGIRSTLVRGRAMAAELATRHAVAALARQDALTRLPNRLALDEHLAALAAAHRPATIYCVDLDGFKQVNDQHGHLAGDALLQAVGARLRDLLGPDDLAARMGGDEFVLVRGFAEPEAARLALALRITAAVTAPLAVGEATFQVGVSIGTAALHPGEPPSAALARADDDLYRWKRHRALWHGRRTLRRLHPGLTVASATR